MWLKTWKWKFLYGHCIRFCQAKIILRSLGKPIWKSKVPLKVALFGGTTSIGKVLTLDNLRRGIVVMELCYMSMKHGESVDHLLLH